jgi:hypothetical protein
MTYGIDRPAPGHECNFYRYNRGRSNIGGASGSFYGSRLRCECGFTAKVNVAPSKGGKRELNEDYRRHLKEQNGG